MLERVLGNIVLRKAWKYVLRLSVQDRRLEEQESRPGGSADSASN